MERPTEKTVIHTALPQERSIATSAAGETTPAIVVVAYNRPAALDRLLTGLARLRMEGPADVDLIISVDGAVPETMEVAHRYTWPFGEKVVIGRPERLGLRAHVLSCGDLAEEYGSIVMLEDDLYVSPDAYRFARQATSFYGSIEQIAGVSLYAYRLDEFLRLAFHPLDDGFDTFFMQLPSSWGQVWTADQWRRFRAWEQEAPPIAPTRLPRRAAQWQPERSWKRRFLEYLIDTDRYFVFPRASLTSNCGDAGEHFRRPTINFTTPLALGPRPWRLAPWEADAIRYDAWFEPTRETIAARWPGFEWGDVTIDFRGSKLPEQTKTARLLSSRPCKDSQSSFPLLLQPEAMNLDLPGQGSFFHLGAAPCFDQMPQHKQRRMIEFLNGEIGHKVAVGILLDRIKRRLRSHK